MTQISDSKTRAATLAGFTEWHRQNAQRFLFSGKRQASPYVLPRQLAPMPTSNALSYLRGDPTDSPHKDVVEARRAVACALMHPGPSEQLQELLGSDDDFHLEVPSLCVASVSRRRASPRRAPIEDHDTTSGFEPDTLITVATAAMTITEASDSLWERLVIGSDPTNWKHAASLYFKLSDPYGERKFRKVGWEGQLHEVFQWNWNPDSVASYENILDIDFSGTTAKGKPAESIAEATSIDIEYSLSNCIATDLWAARQSGGLDIDDGHLKLTREGSSIKVDALKRLRYTQPQIAPDGFVLMLAYLTPAVLALWLDRSVYQGVSEALNATDLAHPPSPHPSGGDQPSPPISVEVPPPRPDELTI